MFEQAFRNIDDVLRKEAGCTTELDYTEQTSWLLFLKYLDGLEQPTDTPAIRFAQWLKDHAERAKKGRLLEADRPAPVGVKPVKTADAGGTLG